MYVHKTRFISTDIHCTLEGKNFCVYVLVDNSIGETTSYSFLGILHVLRASWDVVSYEGMHRLGM